MFFQICAVGLRRQNGGYMNIIETENLTKSYADFTAV